MNISEISFLLLFAGTFIYAIIKQSETFKIKFIISIPILILIYYFTRSLIFLPIYLFSLISATYLYTVFFYIPFAVDTVLILTTLFDHILPLKVTLLSVSSAILLSMFLDKNIKKYAIENEKQKGKDIKIETYRDYFQISTGIITIILFLTFGKTGKLIILFAVLVIYLFGNILYLNREYRITNIVYRMEREDTKLGLGSMYLAAGFLFVMAFVKSVNIIILSAFIIMIGDSLATILGMKIKSVKLFYNKRKSLAGFLAMFIPSFIFGTFIIFYIYSFTYSLVSSFSESISNKIADDNITIPVSIVIIHFIISVM